METNTDAENKSRRFPFGSLIISIVLVVGAIIYSNSQDLESIRPVVAPVATNAIDTDFELPIIWGDVGAKMVADGGITGKKFESLYSSRGELTDEMMAILYGPVTAKISMTQENAGFLLNMFWAFGLGNKNPVLETGPMVNYDGKEPTSRAEALVKAGNFASTGCWSLSVGDSMNHYS